MRQADSLQVTNSDSSRCQTCDKATCPSLYSLITHMEAAFVGVWWVRSMWSEEPPLTSRVFSSPRQASPLPSTCPALASQSSGAACRLQHSSKWYPNERILPWHCERQPKHISTKKVRYTKVDKINQAYIQSNLIFIIYYMFVYLSGKATSPQDGTGSLCSEWW